MLVKNCIKDIFLALECKEDISITDSRGVTSRVIDISTHYIYTEDFTVRLYEYKDAALGGVTRPFKAGWKYHLYKMGYSVVKNYYALEDLRFYIFDWTMNRF